VTRECVRLRLAFDDKMNDEGASRFRSCLEAAVSDFGLSPLDQDQTSKLEAHYRLMLEWNTRINLTRITAAEEAAHFHYAESLLGSRFIGNGSRVLDIGSGAGFPGIPLAVIRPDINVTGLESIGKKALFLNECKLRLSLGNFSVVCSRLEEFDWSNYDLLTCRALDKAERLLPKILTRLSSRQKLMVYAGRDLVAKLERVNPNAEKHLVPGSENRLIAIFEQAPFRSG